MHYAVLGRLLIINWLEKAPSLRRHLHDTRVDDESRGLVPNTLPGGFSG
jgi:hypothetical protein